MEGHGSFHLLHNLMNVAVEDGDGPEALEQVEGLSTILGGPTPFRVCGPQRNVSENHNRSAGPQLGHIVLEPRHLLGSNRTQAFELRGIVQTDEVNALVVEALPAAPAGVFSETLEVLLAVVAQQIVFAW